MLTFYEYGQQQFKMATVSCDAGFVELRLVQDGLEGLNVLLAKNEAYISGSYLVPWYEPVTETMMPDVDIWIPYRTDPLQIRKCIADITAFLYNRGYKLPRTSYPSRHRRGAGVPRVLDAYQRINHMIDQIICFRGLVRPVQVMVMNEQGGSSPEDIIRHFDLTIVQRYYNGKALWSTPRSITDIDNRSLQINTSSEVIMAQSFPEWIRTLGRLHKYSTRGYTVSSSVLQTFLQCVPASAAVSARITTSRNFTLNRLVHELNIASYINEWNRISPRITGWPSSGSPMVALTVRPPGNEMHDLYVCLICTTSLMPIPWSIVSDKHCRRLLPAHVLMDERRTLFWNNAEHLMSTLTPFPVLDEVTSTAFVPSVEEIVHDHITLEDQSVQAYINQDPGNHFVCYDLLCCPNTLTREQIKNAKVYLPCRTKYSASNLEVAVEHKACVTISTGRGTYYIPCTQLEEFMCMPGTRRFQLVETDLYWDCSSLLIHSPQDRQDAQSYVGGISNNGGPWSNKAIHFIRRLG
jgi:hypothetical protein